MYYPQSISPSSSKYKDFLTDLNKQYLLLEDISNNDKSSTDPVDGYNNFLKELSKIMEASPQSDDLTKNLPVKNTLPSNDDTLELNDVFAQKNKISLEDSDYYEDFVKIINEVNKLGQESALQTAMSTYIDAFLEVEGQKKLLDINNQSTRAVQELDQQLLALRYNYLVLSKQVEQYVLDAQQAEQLKNTFFSLEFTMAQNSQALTKTVVNAAKY